MDRFNDFVESVFDSGPAGCLLGFAFFFILAMGGLGIASYFIDKKQCSAQFTDSGYEFRYGFWEGCMIKVNGKWAPASMYRNIEQG